MDDLGVDGRIILKLILSGIGGEGWAWTGLIWLRIGAGDGACECGHELSGSIKIG